MVCRTRAPTVMSSIFGRPYGAGVANCAYLCIAFNRACTLGTFPNVIDNELTPRLASAIAGTGSPAASPHTPTSLPREADPWTAI